MLEKEGHTDGKRLTGMLQKNPWNEGERARQVVSE